MLEWSDLRYLLAIARRQTLLAAARDLGVNHTTVGRRLSSLEAALGSRLFDRVDQRLLPTVAGEIAVRRAIKIEAEILGTAIEIAGRDKSLSGKVRLTSVSMIINLLALHTSEFISKFPDIHLQFLRSQSNLNLANLEADIALRLARPTVPSAITRRVGTIKYGVFAARKFAKDASGLPWIAFAEPMSDIPEARWQAQQMGDEQPYVFVNDIDARISVVANNPCRTILPMARVSPDSDLVLLSGPTPVVTRDVWLVYMKALRHNARIAAVSQWASDVCREHLR